MGLSALQKTTGISKKKQIIPNILTGTGFDQLARATDNIFGSPVQRLFSIQLPVIGNTGLIDFLNYVIHAGGVKFDAMGLVAVAGAKFVGGTLPVLAGSLSIPGLNKVANPNVVASGPGAPF